MMLFVKQNLLFVVAVKFSGSESVKSQSLSEYQGFIYHYCLRVQVDFRLLALAILFVEKQLINAL